MNNYQITYSIGSIGDVQLTVYTELDKDHPHFEKVIDELCVKEIIKEVSDYGKIKSYD